MFSLPAELAERADTLAFPVLVVAPLLCIPSPNWDSPVLTVPFHVILEHSLTVLLLIRAFNVERVGQRRPVSLTAPETGVNARPGDRWD